MAIHLYADKLQLCNPLGAKRGKHEITAVYYILGNIHPEFRSQQHLIHSALLVKHKYVKECGSDYADVMQPLLHDLNSLQLDGITISVNGCKRIVKGKLIAVSADNLTAHALGGFQQFFHSGHICRYITQTLLHTILVHQYNDCLAKCAVDQAPRNARSVRDKKRHETDKRRRANTHMLRLNFADEILQILAMAQGDSFVRSVTVSGSRVPCILLYTDRQVRDLKSFCFDLRHLTRPPI